MIEIIMGSMEITMKETTMKETTMTEITTMEKATIKGSCRSFRDMFPGFHK